VKRFFLRLVLTAPLLVLSMFVATPLIYAAPAQHAGPAQKHFHFKHACSQASKGNAACLAIVSDTTVPAPRGGVVTPLAHASGGTPLANPPGDTPPYMPQDLHNAYNLPNTAAGTQTIAIVDAYNDPNAERDLAYYRSTFGLPACTTANGCFRKVNQTGGTSYPPANTGWAEEISLDLDMASAICNNCHILLVEARSTSFSDLGTAVNEAVRLGANEVSNSYGSNGEVSNEGSYCNSYYTHNGVAVTVSSGDSGPAVDFPAVCPHVVAVGGTTLNSDGSETIWDNGAGSGAGGGCSSIIASPPWQNSSETGCGNRAVADVSAVADPNTGLYVYDTYNQGGWLSVGGTSASSPIIAAVYGLAGNAGSVSDPASIPWNNQSYGCLNDVPSGSGTAYAYQSGLGTPNGTGCF